jgi:hypothetical protein
MKMKLIAPLLLTALLSPRLFAGWSEMQRLTFRGNEINPQVAARHDTVHVAWQQAGGSVSYIRSTDNGLTWGQIIDMTETGHAGSFPNLIVTAEKIWIGWMDNNGAIALRSSQNGSAWSTPIYKYTIDSQRFTYLCMAVNNDTVFLSYMSFIDDSTGLAPFKFLRSPDSGQTWNNLITIGHSIIDTEEMKLIYGNNYLLLVLSTAPDSSGYHILGYMSNNYGQTWSDTIWISPRIPPFAQSPFVAYNSITNQFATAYMDYRFQQYAAYGDIFVCISEVNPLQWISESQVTNEHTSRFPSLIFRGSYLATVWSDRKYMDTGLDEIFFNSSTDGGLSWIGNERLTHTTGWSLYPWIYGDSNFRHVVWYDYDNSAQILDIYYMKYTPDSSEINDDKVIMPSSFSISAYPNPFNSSLSIKIEAEEKGEIYITDILGRFVSKFEYPKGISTLKWNVEDSDGKALPSGAYFIKRKGGSIKDILKVMYLK